MFSLKTMSTSMKYLTPLFLLLLLSSCSKSQDEISSKAFEIQKISVGNAQNQSTFTEVNPNDTIFIEFTDNIEETSVRKSITLQKNSANVHYNFQFKKKNLIGIIASPCFDSFSTYQLTIHPNLRSTAGVTLSNGKVCTIKVGMDNKDKFNRITDEELMTLVQKQTFKYFWDFAHETSGMARERSTSGNTVTTGGTGFGIMSMIVAVERGFISRQEAVQRMNRITTFLKTNCTTYHGAFAHWINGETGHTIAFSESDNGADLVETALLFQGLLTARAYFNQAEAQETLLRNNITSMWEAIDWKWFQKNGENKLYWHWSPTNGWQMNMPISGWNEALIVYALAASSPTYPIHKEVYDQGWAQNGRFKNGQSYYGYKLPLGPEKGGPLFLSQYSFLGINPKGLKDAYADYWEQNINHTLINYQYCMENPKSFSGYGENCWGLTASDGDKGYNAFSPTNDQGVIAPTAALSAFPYTPEQSLKALHFYYYKLGDKLWKDHGFVDAFNLSSNWYDNQHLAIDQGPIIIMIENYRTGLLWRLFMSVPEIQTGLKRLGFNSPMFN